MTPRILAWQRQALSDLEAARLTAAAGLHAQACYLAGQAAEKALKAQRRIHGEPLAPQRFTLGGLQARIDHPSRSLHAAAIAKPSVPGRLRRRGQGGWLAAVVDQLIRQGALAGHGPLGG